MNGSAEVISADGMLPNADTVRALSEGLGPEYFLVVILFGIGAFLAFNILKRDRQNPQHGTAAVVNEIADMHRRLDEVDKGCAATSRQVDRVEAKCEQNAQQIANDRDRIARLERWYDQTRPGGGK